MKYINLDKEKAREVCRLHKKNCKECPLRREHYYEKIKKTLIRFCAYELEKYYNLEELFYSDDIKAMLSQERYELFEEEIQYPRELQQDLLTIIDRKKEK